MRDKFVIGKRLQHLQVASWTGPLTDTQVKIAGVEGERKELHKRYDMRVGQFLEENKLLKDCTKAIRDAAIFSIKKAH